MDNKHAMQKLILIFSLQLMLAFMITGCATGERAAVPIGLENDVYIKGFPDLDKIRIWGDEPVKNIARRLKTVQRQSNLSGQETGAKSILVLSGGGADGAFGAGLLNGWRQRGTRPRFQIVTGVSTGALIAPFAFLGTAKDDKILAEFYTSLSTKDILHPTILAGLFGGAAAITSSAPLQKLIEKHIDRKTFRRIAAEHRRGRRLLIGTTNLDAQRPVIWNMGAIATAGTPQALQLFRQIILASASIPGVFPPVMIDVEANGQALQEMHVDGGTTDNIILLPASTILPRHAKRTNLYVIANSRLFPQWQSVKATTASIASRSIDTLIKQQTLGDILKIYDFAKRNRMAFHLASVPPDFHIKPQETFDKAYMQALFKLGRKMGRKGYKWQKDSPVY